MAISPRFAAVSAGDPEFPHDSPVCVYSFDLDGNVLEMNAAMAGVLGHTREEASRMNLGQLLEPESWKDSREQILVQLGGGGPQWANLTAIASDGRRVQLAVVRRLLFERGRPVAIQDTGRVLADVSETGSPALEDPHTQESSHSNRFAEQLKQLHRLSTTSYVTLEQALQDHLETGCRLFQLPVGMLLQVEGDNGAVQASHGRAELKGSLIPLAQTRAYSVTSRLRTLTASEPALAGSPGTEMETYIGTPVWLGSELFATLSFSGPFGGAPRVFSHADRELIELMARSIGRVVLEHRIQSERDRLQSLEKNRNRVLEMVAENESIAIILEEVVHLVEAQCPGALCSLLLLKDEMLAWVAAPGFPVEALRLLKPFRVLRDTAGLASAEVARGTVYWDDIRSCPFWADRARLAVQLGIESCHSTPILSVDGMLMGMLALHYKTGQPRDESDGELLEAASRLAARALEQRGFTERLEFQARHDSLTGLPNRSYFMELLEAALRDASERSGSLAVLFIDLDRFKQINDILGHAMGDRLLKEVGQRLKRLLTEDDLAGRMGGDEFTIVLTRQPDEQTAVLASQEFLNAFRAPHQIEDNELFVTASIGVSLFPRHGQSVAELLRHADLAMYHAKNSGKNDVVVFRAKDHTVSLERLRLENALRRALEHQEFELLYQPVVSMNGKVEGLEALLTWRHPIYGSISPKQFIPIAEETGLIIDIGSWVIQRACLEAASWHKAGHRAARISVNVSALQFERRDFLETVAAALALSKLPPDRLELEITESYIMKDLPQAAARLTQIRNLGVSIAIDDFGTGYSSLSYLNKLPVDSLKIDQSFLRNLHEPEGSLAVIQSIVRMAHSMNLTVVAEGVETRAELDLVRVLGCDKVQGHVYGPARRREEMEALLSGNDSLRPVDS
ncbi:MAG: EAL domain-containing protein [Bryobacteraceae bacterium]|jgi:diguanylate cyclase (GGDEF)-like protein/PAS domain S-box-containing protein